VSDGIGLHSCSTLCTCDFGWYPFRSPNGQVFVVDRGTRTAIGTRSSSASKIWWRWWKKPEGRSASVSNPQVVTLPELNRLLEDGNARAKVEQQQPATGMTLIVLVGLAIAFLLFMAFLNVVKSGNLLNETTSSLPP